MKVPSFFIQLFSKFVIFVQCAPANPSLDFGPSQAPFVAATWWGIHVSLFDGCWVLDSVIQQSVFPIKYVRLTWRSINWRGSRVLIHRNPNIISKLLEHFLPHLSVPLPRQEARGGGILTPRLQCTAARLPTPYTPS